jgi:hypothetical protein
VQLEMVDFQAGPRARLGAKDLAAVPTHSVSR